MILIVGLGNPGQQYAETRHNLGFRVVDTLAGRWDVSVEKSKFHGLAGDGVVAGRRVTLLKPMTFMNRSGTSVRAACQFYKLEVTDLLLVLDDLDLRLAQLRFRSSGSAGGHRGLEDIVRCLGTQDLARLRLGIGHGPGEEMVSHVLSRFRSDELTEAEIAVERAADAVECWLSEGPEATMNRFNVKPTGP